MKRYITISLHEDRCTYCDREATRTHEVHEGETILQYPVCLGCLVWLEERDTPLDESEAPF